MTPRTRRVLRTLARLGLRLSSLLYHATEARLTDEERERMWEGIDRCRREMAQREIEHHLARGGRLN